MSHDELDIAFHAATAAQYDATITREYAIYHRGWVSPRLDRLAREFSGGTVLDVGCGTGVLTLALATRGFHVVGIDHSPEMLAIAREKTAAAGLDSKITLEVGKAAHLAFADESFDGATAQGVLHHLADPVAAVGELARVVRTGGFIFISEPCADRTLLNRLGEAAFRVAGRVRRRAGSSRGTAAPETVERPLDGLQLVSSLTAAGLDSDIRYAVHVPQLHRVVPDAVRLPLVKLLSLPSRSHNGDLVFIVARKTRRIGTPLSSSGHIDT